MRKKILIVASALVLASPTPAFAYGEAVNGFKAMDHCVSHDSPAWLNLFNMNIWIRCGWF